MRKTQKTIETERYLLCLPETLELTGDVMPDNDPESDEYLHYVFRSRDREKCIGLCTILKCLRFAGREGVLPVFPSMWWSIIEDLYPALFEPSECWTESENGYQPDGFAEQAEKCGKSFFLLRAGEQCYTIRLTDALECLYDAERSKAVLPEIGGAWWNMVSAAYPGLLEEE